MIYIGLDDTDVVDFERGTGKLARQLAPDLERFGVVFGISRHQLLVDPRVPMTKRNSSACLHLQSDVSLDELGEFVAEYVGEISPVGSDPGVCVARRVPAPITAFGRRAQTELVRQQEARQLAAAHGLFLRGLGGTEDGVIGALSAVGLGASGQDGRFILVGAMRELDGVQPIAAVLAAGITAVRDTADNPITEGLIQTGGKLRPALRDGRPVLYVERGDPYWLPLKLD
ncbi:MAG: ABC transporter substrate-binding protein [Chloroflexi bacterium]|nr:ABC transporter substrate-binding protein [Chloroflexota bacterium]